MDKVIFASCCGNFREIEFLRNWVSKNHSTNFPEFFSGKGCMEEGLCLSSCNKSKSSVKSENDQFP